MEKNEFSSTHQTVMSYVKQHLQDKLGKRNQRMTRILRTSVTDFLNKNPQCTEDEVNAFLKSLFSATGEAITHIDSNKHFVGTDLNEKLNDIYTNFKDKGEEPGDQILRTQYFEPRHMKGISDATAEKCKAEIEELQLAILTLMEFVPQSLKQTVGELVD
ncbi:MAG TPA: hypothetical protein PK950_01955 [Candidatus Paceibacterota bacterium]|nr:hypothetical protein [Candidatus Paceibacterota bacterium]